MAVQVPTSDQLRAIADEMGLSLTAADIESFIRLMRPTVALFVVPLHKTYWVTNSFARGKGEIARCLSDT